MNILMVLETQFPPDLRVENEIDALLDAGHNVTIIAGFRKKLKKIDYYNKAKIIRVYIPKFIYKSSIGCLNHSYYFSFWTKVINQELLTHSYDAMHIHDLPLAKVGIELRKGLNQTFRIVLDLHENYPDMLKIAKHTNTYLGKLFFNYSQWKHYERLMVEQVDTVITVVEEMKFRFVAQGIDPNKIVVVSNTFNTKKFTPPVKAPNENNFVLFYGGGVTIDRGLQFILPALKDLAVTIPNIKVWIIGDGSYLRDLKNLALKLHVEHFVKFYGRKSFSDLLLLLARSHIALIPHIKSPQTESGLPHKLFQYMITEIPIIASNCSPFIRILGDNQAGLIYEFDKTEDFVSKVITLYQNPQLQKQLTSKAKDLLFKKYLWEYDAERLVKIY